jgi:PKD repeat protein
VIGTHTYTTVTTPGTPDKLTVLITTIGGVSTTLTDPLGDGVTVLDAPLTSSNGTEITGIEGIITPDTAPSIVGTLLGSFTDANQGATIAEFTSGGGSVVVNWGDGTVVQTLAAANLTVNGLPNGVEFTINASHIYADEGTYAYTVTVLSAGGSTTTISGSAIIADAPLTAVATAPIFTTESSVYPVPEFGAPIFTGIVGEFTDANPKAPLSDFTATIDWGDGTPNSAAVITEPGGVGTAFFVTGSHTYASTGPVGSSYPIQVFVVDAGGSKVTLHNTATVAAGPNNLNGILNPASDSGKSNVDEITNVTQPNFYGTTLPFANVTLYATPAAGGTPVAVGIAEASSDGGWSSTTNLLATGTYTITATATDQFGLNPTGPVVVTSSLVVDTIPPVITNLTFNRFDATLTVTYQDNLSGMDLASITNSAFYHISARPLSSKVHVPKLILPTQIYYTPGALPTDPIVVNVVFNNGKVFRGGKYTVLIDSGTGDAGIQDVAGNPLDGNYYGAFSTGDLLPGGNFVAEIYTFHRTILPFVPIADGYSPPPKGIDPPAGSAVSVTTTQKAKHSTKVVAVSATQRVAAKAAKLKAFDAALSELHAESKAKGKS